MSRRALRVASLIRSVIAEAIQSHLSDPRIEPMTSVTRVEVSADFSLARVHLSVMATETHRALCLDAIRSATGRLRSLVARRISMRQVPRLEFQLDDSLRRGAETLQIIDQAMAELDGEQAQAEPRDPDAGGQSDTAQEDV